MSFSKEKSAPAKTLVFDACVFGHHLEYLHHLYERARALPQREFVFAVPEDFKTVSKTMEWIPAENISFHFFDGGKKLSPRSCSRFVGSLAKKYGVGEIFLISLMSFLPWLPLFVPARIRVSGIVYMIYLYRWKRSGFLTRALDVLKYLLFSRCRVFSRVFLLNDHAAPRYLNAKYRTKKFRYLPDPVAIPTDLHGVNIRAELGIPADARIFSHFGGLSEIDRKGTVSILNALIEMPPQNGFAYVFAGRVGKMVSARFYELVERAKARGHQILVFDKFCEYEFLLNLCVSSDAILIPYQNTDQSSGVIAYAAASGTPVVAPTGGLLEKIIKRNHLGLFFRNASPAAIREFLGKNAEQCASVRVSADYLREASVTSFSEAIFPTNSDNEKI